MRFDHTIKLINFTSDENAAGDTINTPTPRAVFAEKKSIRQSEAYQAAATGLKPELMFVIREEEYEDETQLEHENKSYTIIRAFTKIDGLLELICTALVIPITEPDEGA